MDGLVVDITQLQYMYASWVLKTHVGLFKLIMIISTLSFIFFSNESACARALFYMHFPKPRTHDLNSI